MSQSYYKSNDGVDEKDNNLQINARKLTTNLVKSVIIHTNYSKPMEVEQKTNKLKTKPL